MHFIGISGSSRNGSYNMGLMKEFLAQVPAGSTMEIVDISIFPLYNQDLEVAFPGVVTDVKNKIKAADGILVATPEYNRSIPAALKNALDWTSRPYGDNAWAGKPVYVMGASSGPIAAALAQYDVKKVLTYLNARVLGQPEFYVGNAGDKFDATGTLTDVSTKEHVVSAWTVFTAFCAQLAK